MTGIKILRRFLFSLWRHGCRIFLSGNAARSELLTLNVFFGEGWFDAIRLGSIGFVAMCGGILSAHVALLVSQDVFD